MRNSAVAQTQSDTVVVNPEEKYCDSCGSEMQERRAVNFRYERFDQKTGKEFSRMQCVNSKCKKGCPNTHGGRHHVKGFIHPRCVRCGTDELFPPMP